MAVSVFYTFQWLHPTVRSTTALGMGVKRQENAGSAPKPGDPAGEPRNEGCGPSALANSGTDGALRRCGVETRL